MNLPIKYYNNFDGLRAISVVLVLLFHSNINQFWFGWIGVQVFFVLSGFLITNILLNSKQHFGYFTLFYLRRILRIFPIYYLLILFTIAYSVTNHLAIRDIIYCIFYIQNFPLASNNWFLRFPEFLNHTWSLAVEEQFYMVFPAVVKFLNIRQLQLFCIISIFGSIILKIVLLILIPGKPLIWANTFSCSDFLFCGSLLAISHKVYDLKVINKTLIIGMAILLTLYMSLNFIFFQRILFCFPIILTNLNGILFLILLLPFCAILVHCLSQDIKNKYLNFIFTNSLVKYLGKISYGLYLYHYLVYYFVDQYSGLFFQKLTIVNLLIKVTITLFISIISWELIEKNILKLKGRIEYKKNA